MSEIKSISGFCASLMDDQRERLDKALRRRGECPTDGKEPSELVHTQLLSFNWFKARKPCGDSYILDASIIAPYYPPSTAPLERLKKLYVKDLRLETHHRGYYLVLATAMFTFKIAGVSISLMRDENNTLLKACHYFEDVENVDMGGHFIIKEPYFTLSTYGEYCLRVDHVTDVIQVHHEHEQVPMQLRPKLFESLDYWKDYGNGLMGKGNYQAAAVAYSTALSYHSTPSESDTLRMNRALAHLRIKSYDEALKDVQPLIGRSHPPEKALYRASQALYHLDQYRKCSQVLEKLLQYYPENKVAIREVARVQRRLREQNFGQYDFGSMYNASKDEPLSLDNATYIGSVKVQESRGRGGGLFTTKNVAAGELLLCEKAFCYSYEQREGEEAEDPSKIVILANILTNRGTTGTQTHLMKNVIQKLKWNPSLLPSVSALHHGSYVPVQERYVDDGPIIDTFLIYHIVSLNTFGCPITSQESHANGRVLPSEKIEDQHSSSGLWITASRINHSCFSNARRSFIGNIQIVRSACDMLPDTEITFIYQTGKPDGTESHASRYSKATQIALQNWGFECTCAICTYDTTTPVKLLQYREDLLNKLEMSFKHFGGPQLGKAEKLLTALEKTYALPAVEVPRVAIWQPYLFVTRHYVKLKNPQKTISTALNLLRALGFIIHGLPVEYDVQASKIKSSTKKSSDDLSLDKLSSDGQLAEEEAKFQVKTWGLVVDHVIEVFMHIWSACQTIQPELCGPVEMVAKTAYVICVGEAETFWQTYGKWYGMKET